MYLYGSLCDCEILLIFPFIPSLPSLLQFSGLCILPGTLEIMLIPSSPLHSLQVPAACPTLLSAAWVFASIGGRTYVADKIITLFASK